MSLVIVYNFVTSTYLYVATCVERLLIMRRKRQIPNFVGPGCSIGTRRLFRGFPPMHSLCGTLTVSAKKVMITILVCVNVYYARIKQILIITFFADTCRVNVP